VSPRGLVLDRSGRGGWGRGGMRAVSLPSGLDWVRVGTLPTASGGHGAERLGGVRGAAEGRGAGMVFSTLTRCACVRMIKVKGAAQ
jgi:hypothetical protein